MTAQSNKGYTKQLCVLPFDHRASFQEKMFGIKGQVTPEQQKLIASYKMMIFDAFEKTVATGLPRETMGILTDEQFGADVIRAAKQKGFVTCVAAEKSGQDEFDFEYGADFGKHIEQFNPDLVKVLVRYNPESDPALNKRQSTKLAQLSKYLEQHNRKFMFELLVPATEQQLQKCGGNKATYDVEMRPALMGKAIQELRAAGVDPDVWKIEGLDRKVDFDKIAAIVHADGRPNVGCIVLGRGENDKKVTEWLTIGAKVDGVIGFAVGRTVFWEPLKGYKEGKLTREQAVDQMAKTYGNYCKIWLELRK